MLFLMLALGVALLVAGGELLVRGASRLALGFGVSPMIVGLTIVGFGTSTPELVTSLEAAFAGAPGVAVGNVVGSNIANILLILGLATLLRPMTIERASFLRDGAVLVAVTLLCSVALATGEIGRTIGFGFLALLALYLGLMARTERRASAGAAVAAPAAEEPDGDGWPQKPLGALVAFAAGLGLTLLGATVLVEAAIDLARLSGLSETLIGLTIVAIGTSLPELAATTAAALKGRHELALGNIIGSNIFNVLGILGATGAIVPIATPAEIVSVDIWVMMAATAALLVVAVSGWRITRLEGGALFAGYCGYLGLLIALA